LELPAAGDGCARAGKDDQRDRRLPCEDVNAEFCSVIEQKH